MQGDITRLEVDGKLGITGGRAPLPALVGGAAKIGLGVSVARQGQDIVLSRLQLDGKTLTLSADGGIAAHVADLNWKIALSDLAVVAPTVSGRVSAQGHVAGPQDNLALTADVSGEVRRACRAARSP
jgi:autotransporter translocation and assembly factor TamB